MRSLGDSGSRTQGGGRERTTCARPLPPPPLPPPSSAAPGAACVLVLCGPGTSFVKLQLRSGGGEREEQITSNVGLNSFLVALGRFVKNVIEGNKVNRALRQSERCRPCWGSPSVEVFHGNGHGLCMCYMLWLVRRGISGGGGGEPALGTGFAERAEWRQTSSGGGGPNPEATSAWGAGEGLRLRGEALMAALGSLRSVCATARSPRGQKCSVSDSSVRTRVLHSLETAPSAFLQRQFPSSSELPVGLPW